MIGRIVTTAALALAGAGALAGQGAPVAPGELLGAGLAPGVVQPVEVGTSADGTTTARLRLDGAPATLVLRPHAVRAPGFAVRVAGADGRLVSVSAPPPATLRGVVAGRPDSRVAATRSGGRLTALVRPAPSGPVFVVQPLAGGAASEHAVYRADEALAPPASCGLDPTAAPDGTVEPVEPVGPLEIVELACDADTEFLADLGSVDAVVAEIEATVNAVGAIYLETDLIDYVITEIVVRAAEPDPYDTSAPSALLTAFQDEWNTNQTGVERRLAHLFTGKDLSGAVIGIARLDVDLCAGASPVSDAYALSQTTFTFLPAWRVALVAHEIGHNWGALHCDTDPDCAIMCSVIANCPGGIDAFGDASRVAIDVKKNTTPCFTTGAAPTLSSVAPDVVPSFEPGPMTASGDDLGAVTALTVGGVSVPFTVTSPEAVTFTPPAPAALGATEVVATSPQGSSEAVTFSFLANVPPVLSAPDLATTGFPFDWSWGSGPGDTIGLLASLSAATVPVAGFEVLGSFVVTIVEPADAAGLGGVSVVMPASVAGVTVHTQVVAFDEEGFVGASDVPSTWIVF